MSDRQTESYEEIVHVFQQTQSVKQVVEKTGIAKLTVQKVLLTEGLWESKRSREVLRLKNEGHTTEEIAELLHITVKGVQAYLPYSRKPYGIAETNGAIRSRKKREKMRIAAERQVPLPEKKEFVADNPIEIPEYEIGEIIYDKPTQKENSSSKTIKAPSLYRLHLELVKDEEGSPVQLNKDEVTLLQKFARFNTGFSRDIVVPADMTLHALHYAIQKLFGWENSHLRQFSLMPKDFDAVTNGMTASWESLCGVLFRFPQEDDQEPYWDDDYEGLQSFKTWLKHKYRGPYQMYGIRDTYYDNQSQFGHFRKEFEKTTKQSVAPTLNEFKEQVWLGGDFNCLMERLRISELLVPESIGLPDLSEWKNTIQNSIYNVRKTLSSYSEEFAANYMRYVIEMQYGISRSEGVSNQISFLRRMVEPMLMPFVREILYQYDFGDGWCVKVSCEEGYYYNDLFDIADDRFVVAKLNDKDFVADRDYYRSRDNLRVDDKLNDVLRYVEWKKFPACVTADGMNLVDDVGGIHGYVDFIRTLHGENKEEAREIREWAESLGWSTRMNKPEKML